MDFDREFLTGAVTTLILALLAEQPRYAYEILREAERRSDNQFLLKEGTLYPALHQMERAGWLASEWRDSEAGRQRKYYRLTALGRRRATSKREQWEAMSAAMRSILGVSHG
jgi:PadR family transcriptional regulator PadR